MSPRKAVSDGRADGRAESKNTPGPWTLEREGSTLDLMGGGFWIATLQEGYDADEANARLIAAAPDLLGAAKRMVAEVEAQNGVCKEKDPKFCEVCNLRAAIAKAQGQGVR